MNRRRKEQEEQYSFPYHYLPHFEQGVFQQHRYWSSGYRYLGRLKVALDLLHSVPFTSLLDIGCGDGRFLKEVQNSYGNKRLLGIDASQKAIELARRINPALEFVQQNILGSSITSDYDFATLLDVLEHIPRDAVCKFMTEVAHAIVPGGYLIITVPHTNSALISKHYQHFDSNKLLKLLSPDFEDIQFTPFDYLSYQFRIIQRLAGGCGKYFIITHHSLSTAIFKYYMKKCLYGSGEKKCKKIACLARKRE